MIGDLTFPNPIGLAAGFDKGAELLNVLPLFGFGFIEVGTFTPKPQVGQPKPRLFRFTGQQALINRMGFNNPGVDVLPERFGKFKPRRRIPVGINIGMGKNTLLTKAGDDYQYAFTKAFPYADYIAINISSPNTPGLRDLQSIEHLKRLLSNLQQKNNELARKAGIKPRLLFTKLSPDLDDESVADMAKICVENNSGVIATNTTLNHSGLLIKNDQQGGLSGKPLKTRSNEVLKIVADISYKRVPVIGVGGIFSAQDVKEKLALGANLVQIYSGWIYEGPALVKAILTSY